MDGRDFSLRQSEQIYNCPSDSTGALPNLNAPYKYHPGDGSRGQGYDYGSYGANNTYYDIGPDALPPFSSAATLASISAPATTIWVGEILPIDTTSQAYADFEFNWASRADQPIAATVVRGTPTLVGTASSIGIAARHLETTNILYCDGHVKSVRLDSLLQPGNTGYYKAFTSNDD